MLPVDSCDSIETLLQRLHPEIRLAGKRPFRYTSGSLYRKVTLMKQLVFSLMVVLFTGSHIAQLKADGKRDNDASSVRRIPRAGIEIPEERERQLWQQLVLLRDQIQTLTADGDSTVKRLLPDVMIFERAVRCALDYNEFFAPKDLDKADGLLQEGLLRAEQLRQGQPKWIQQTGLVVRGYISRIDQTVQPYGLVVPKTYAVDHSVPTRCDVWFHGRGEIQSEVNFIWDRMKSPGRYTPEHTIVLHPYGRYCNAFKFAGETDVLEALEDVQQRYRIDEDRISVRGFSMGGAACWQFAVHFSDRWFAANPGAGFSETPEFLRFFQKETLTPTPWETALWNVYDCNRYARNLTHCPVIAYSGENDIQKQAADVMAEAMLPHDLHLRHVIGPKMGHNIDAGSKQVIEARMNELAHEGLRRHPTEIHFQTHTLKYNRQHWLTVNGLQEHWKPAQVDIVIDAQRLQKALRTDSETPTVGPVLWIHAQNVTHMTIEPPVGVHGSLATAAVEIHITDSDREQFIRANGPLSDGSCTINLARDSAGHWAVETVPATQLQKAHDLQGPIDDAFMDSFVFVRPTGKSSSQAVDQWAHSEMERAIEHWRRHFRGDARVIDDTDVTDEIIESANLVLWGDPESNQVLKTVQSNLPIEWAASGIRVGRKQFDAHNHVLIAIYPNPLNPKRYVVLNSSFTFRDYAYLNNARQVPMLPDWAIVDVQTPPGNVWPGKIVAADFFDEFWRLKTTNRE